MPVLSVTHRVRAVVNLVNLTTPLGLGIALVGRAKIRRGPEGLWLAERYRFRFPVAGAFTVGNVVTTAATFEAVARHHPDVIGHESRHAWQYAATGLAFLPLYSLATAWSWARSGDLAARNPFERHAGLISGGYLAAGQPTPTWATRRTNNRGWGRPTSRP